MDLTAAATGWPVSPATEGLPRQRLRSTICWSGPVGDWLITTERRVRPAAQLPVVKFLRTTPIDYWARKQFSVVVEQEDPCKLPM